MNHEHILHANLVRTQNKSFYSSTHAQTTKRPIIHWMRRRLLHIEKCWCDPLIAYQPCARHAPRHRPFRWPNNPTVFMLMSVAQRHIDCSTAIVAPKNNSAHAIQMKTTGWMGWSQIQSRPLWDRSYIGNRLKQSAYYCKFVNKIGNFT